MVRRGKKLLVTLPPDPNPLFQIADGHTRVAHLVIALVGKDRQERNQPAMAPADDADALGINLPMVLQHPLPPRVHVLDFQSAIINLAPKIRPVTAAATVV